MGLYIAGFECVIAELHDTDDDSNFYTNNEEKLQNIATKNNIYVYTQIINDSRITALVLSHQSPHFKPLYASECYDHQMFSIKTDPDFEEHVKKFYDDIKDLDGADELTWSDIQKLYFTIS